MSLLPFHFPFDSSACQTLALERGLLQGVDAVLSRCPTGIGLNSTVLLESILVKAVHIMVRSH